MSYDNPSQNALFLSDIWQCLLSSFFIPLKECQNFSKKLLTQMRAMVIYMSDAPVVESADTYAWGAYGATRASSSLVWCTMKKASYIGMPFVLYMFNENSLASRHTPESTPEICTSITTIHRKINPWHGCKFYNSFYSFSYEIVMGASRMHYSSYTLYQLFIQCVITPLL